MGITALSILQVREVKHKRVRALTLATVCDLSSSWIVRSMDNEIWCFSDNRHSDTEAGREKQRHENKDEKREKEKDLAVCLSPEPSYL